MLIDWFTVGAQALNFVILVWLMKRFLYGPILRALDAREKRIAATLSDADAKISEAQTERDEFQRKNEEFERQRAALLHKAREDALSERARLIKEARGAADLLRAKRLETLDNEMNDLYKAIHHQTQREVFAIARKALADLAATSLEERMGEVFIRQLRGIDGQARQEFAQAIKAASTPTIVRSAFDLSGKQRGAIQTALNEVFSTEITVCFETASSLVSGIELCVNGKKIAWSIADYLESLKKGLDQLLNQQFRPESSPEIGVAPARKDMS